MAKFEVFIPAVGPDAFDLTFRVEADNWLAALNTGLKKIGEKGGAGNNFLIDIQDDESIHVTDPKSGRVFRIHEMGVPAPQPAAPPQGRSPDATLNELPNPFDPQPGRSTMLDLPAVAAPQPAREPEPLARAKRPNTEPDTLPPGPAPDWDALRPKPAAPARPAQWTEPEKTQPAAVTLAAASLAAPQPPPRTAPLPAPLPPAQPLVNLAQTVHSPSRPASARPPSVPPPTYNPPQPKAQARPKSSPAMRKPSGLASNVTEVPREEARPPTGRIGREKQLAPEKVDDVLAELFDRVQQLEEYTDPEEALDFILDLAMDKIAAESGSIFLADLSTNDLTLSTARGPKSNELLRLNPRVPMGVGIVGFCALEAVSLAISDVQRDPRFFRAISDRIGYPVKTILCVPMMRNGRSFGCLEVLNKKSSTRFTEGEVAILAYLADATARYLETVG